MYQELPFDELKVDPRKRRVAYFMIKMLVIIFMELDIV